MYVAVEDMISEYQSRNWDEDYPNLNKSISFKKTSSVFVEDLKYKNLNINIYSAIVRLIGSTEYINGSLIRSGYINDIVDALQAYEFYLQFYVGSNITGKSGMYANIATSSLGNDPKVLYETYATTEVTDTMKIRKSIIDSQKASLIEYSEIINEILSFYQKDFWFLQHPVDGEMTYQLPVEEIRNIINKHLSLIWKKRYGGVVDINGKLIEAFSAEYLLQKLHALENNPKESDIPQYYQYLVDYNLYLMSVYIPPPTTNPLQTGYPSLMTSTNNANIGIQNYMSTLQGSGVDTVLMYFNDFLKLWNNNTQDKSKEGNK